VAEEKRLTAPAIFVGNDALIGEDINARSLEALLGKYASTGAPPTWDGFDPTTAQRSIVERFQLLGVFTVAFAGLIDGLNPCAFATIVFFVSYLAFVGRRQREVLAVGVAFTLGVFLTYLGVGVGLLKFMASLPFLSAVSRWVYGLTAALCLFLAAVSLYDWWQARRGKPEEMRLKLPLRLRRWINRVIREGAGLRAFVPVSFVTGVVISVIELACTGQVYLPTIIFVLGVPGLQARAGLYLVLYNLIFILPLVVVFLLAYFGTTSQQLGQFINRRAATVKLATAGLFVLLATWLVIALL
jgi:cytochrome c biogenesis protein CcdA